MNLYEILTIINLFLQTVCFAFQAKHHNKQKQLIAKIHQRRPASIQIPPRDINLEIRRKSIQNEFKEATY